MPILHRLIIHLQDGTRDDWWSDGFVGERESNKRIAANELEDWPDRPAPTCWRAHDARDGRKQA